MFLAASAKREQERQDKLRAELQAEYNRYLQAQDDHPRLHHKPELTLPPNLKGDEGRYFRGGGSPERFALGTNQSTLDKEMKLQKQREYLAELKQQADMLAQHKREEKDRERALAREMMRQMGEFDKDLANARKARSNKPSLPLSDSPEAKAQARKRMQIDLQQQIEAKQRAKAEEKRREREFVGNFLDKDAFSTPKDPETQALARRKMQKDLEEQIMAKQRAKAEEKQRERQFVGSFYGEKASMLPQDLETRALLKKKMQEDLQQQIEAKHRAKAEEKRREREADSNPYAFQTSSSSYGGFWGKSGLQKNEKHQRKGSPNVGNVVTQISSFEDGERDVENDEAGSQELVNKAMGEEIEASKPDCIAADT